MADLSGLKRARRAVTIYFFLLGFGGANWLVHIPTMRHKLGLNDLQLGFFLLSSGIGATVAFRTSRYFLHLLPYQRVISWGTCGAATLMVASTAANSAWLAATALFLTGCCNGLVDISINASAVDVEKRIGKPILSSLHGFCSLGSFAGASCGTLSVGLHLTPPQHMALVAATVSAFSLFYERGMLASAAAVGGSPAPVRLRYTTPLVLLGCVAFCSSVGEGAMAQWTGIYLSDELHTSFQLANVGYWCYSGAMVTGRLLGDRLAGKWEASKLFSRCGALVAVCLAIGLSTQHAWLMILGAMGVGLGLSLVIPTVFRCAVRLPNMSSTAALSSVATLSYGGFLFGPPSIGLVAQAMSLRVALGLVAVLAAIMGLLGTKVAGHLDKAGNAGRLPEVPTLLN